MKKTFSLSALALLVVSAAELLLCTGTNAQCPAPWQWQNPLPQGNTLYSVYFTAPE